jgi:hypothetical protein
MTQAQIQAQIDAIERVTNEALKSKETALQFLIDAGIVKPKRVKKTIRASKSRQQKK